MTPVGQLNHASDLAGHYGSGNIRAADGQWRPVTFPGAPPRNLNTDYASVDKIGWTLVHRSYSSTDVAVGSFQDDSTESVESS